MTLAPEIKHGQQHQKDRHPRHRPPPAPPRRRLLVSQQADRQQHRQEHHRQIERLQVRPEQHEHRGASAEAGSQGRPVHRRIHAPRQQRQPHQRNAGRTAPEQADPSERHQQDQAGAQRRRQPVLREPPQPSPREERAERHRQPQGQVPARRLTQPLRQHGIYPRHGQKIRSGPIAGIVVALVELIGIPKPRNPSVEHVAHQIEVIQQLQLVARNHRPERGMLEILGGRRDGLGHLPRQRPRHHAEQQQAGRRRPGGRHQDAAFRHCRAPTPRRFRPTGRRTPPAPGPAPPPAPRWPRPWPAVAESAAAAPHAAPPGPASPAAGARAGCSR